MDALRCEGDRWNLSARDRLRIAWRRAAAWQGLPLAVSGTGHLILLVAMAFVVARDAPRAEFAKPLAMEVESRRPSLDTGPVLKRAEIRATWPSLPDDFFRADVEGHIEEDDLAVPSAIAAEEPKMTSAASWWRGPSPEAAPAPKPVPAPPAKPRPRTSVFEQAEPLARENPPPRYPRRARAREREGTSVLRVLVLPDGTVGDVKVAKMSGHRDLDAAAVAAVRGWRFRPARRDGIPVESRVLLPVTFRLR